VRDKLLTSPLDLDPFVPEHTRLDIALSRRVNADPESVERGLAQLVLTIVELLRQLMERQALRRIDGGR
jgi:Gas vesicle protein K